MGDESDRSDDPGDDSPADDTSSPAPDAESDESGTTDGNTDDAVESDAEDTPETDEDTTESDANDDAEPDSTADETEGDPPDETTHEGDEPGWETDAENDPARIAERRAHSTPGRPEDEGVDESVRDGESDEAPTDETEVYDGGEGVPETGFEDVGPGDHGEAMTAPEDIEPAEEFLDEQGGPGEDSEMPLTDHVEEMFKRVLVVVAVAGIVSVATYPFSVEIINFLWNSILSETTRPRLYTPLEPLLTKLKVASLTGLIVALPVFVYETYQFMRPGLYPHERRYYLAAVPTSLVLALLGVSFAYFVVLPAVFVYFLNYSEGVAIIGFSLGRTFNLILGLMGYLAIVFQIPLLLMLAMMMNVVTRQWLADRRLLFWGGFLGVSFLMFGPADPTGATPFLVTITMILLFEGTLFLVKWTRRARS